MRYMFISVVYSVAGWGEPRVMYAVGIELASGTIRTHTLHRAEAVRKLDSNQECGSLDWLVALRSLGQLYLVPHLHVPQHM